MLPATVYLFFQSCQCAAGCAFDTHLETLACYTALAYDAHVGVVEEM
jgi:hypothetical protein